MRCRRRANVQRDACIPPWLPAVASAWSGLWLGPPNSRDEAAPDRLARPPGLLFRHRHNRPGRHRRRGHAPPGLWEVCYFFSLVFFLVELFACEMPGARVTQWVPPWSRPDAERKSRGLPTPLTSQSDRRGDRRFIGRAWWWRGPHPQLTRCSAPRGESSVSPGASARGAPV